MGAFGSVERWSKCGAGNVSFEADSKCVSQVRAAVNFGCRREVDGPDILLLHYTGMESAQGAIDWLCCEESGVSCHYLVDEAGEVSQMVREADRAHHAGVGSWEGHTDINSRSIGVEIANPGHEAGLPDFPAAQMQAVLDLSKDIVKRREIRRHLVLGHSDIAPGRKIDPGENFDWAWLAQNDIGHWVAPAPIRSGQYFQQGDAGQPVEALQSMLSLYGYSVEINGEFDNQTRIVIEAFQRHFRQERVDGIADISTIETLHSLLSSRDLD